MSTLNTRKIKHDNSTVDNITLGSDGNLTVAGTISQVKAMTSQYDGIGVRMGSSTANTNRGATFLQHTYVDASGNQGNYVYNHSLRQTDGTYIANVYTADYSAGVHSWYHPNGGLSGNPVMQIDSVGRVTMPYQPAFAYINTSYSQSTGSYSIIIPGTTKFNRGNHFNGTTGVFTAPVSGVYTFGFWGLSYPHGSEVNQIAYFVNGSNSTNAMQFAGNSSSHALASGSYSVYLNSSDTIDLRYYRSSGSGAAYGSQWTMWGYLVG